MFIYFTPSRVCCLFACSLALVGTAAATRSAHRPSADDYVEHFPSDAPGRGLINAEKVGWAVYVGDAAYERTSGDTQGKPAAAVISFQPGMDGEKGFAAKTTTGEISKSLWFTVEFGRLKPSDLASIAFASNNTSTTDAFRVAVRIDGQWYASVREFSNSLVGDATNFEQNGEVKTFEFTDAADAWCKVILTPGTPAGGGTLRLDDAPLSATPPEADIEAAGLYSDGNSATLRFDDFTLTTR